MTKKITEEQFVHAFREVVRNNPNKVNVEVHPATLGCFYFHEDGTPSCVIGTALAECGVEPFLYNSVKNTGTPADAVLNSFEVHDEGVLLAALSAQDAQDTGHSWSAAGDVFEKTLGERSKSYE